MARAHASTPFMPHLKVSPFFPAAAIVMVAVARNTTQTHSKHNRKTKLKERIKKIENVFTTRTFEKQRGLVAVIRQLKTFFFWST